MSFSFLTRDICNQPGLPTASNLKRLTSLTCALAEMMTTPTTNSETFTCNMYSAFWPHITQHIFHQNKQNLNCNFLVLRCPEPFMYQDTKHYCLRIKIELYGFVSWTSVLPLDVAIDIDITLPWVAIGDCILPSWVDGGLGRIGLPAWLPAQWNICLIVVNNDQDYTRCQK